MKIVHTYSFCKGEESFQSEYSSLRNEVFEIICQTDVSDCKTKESKEEGHRKGELLYSPVKMNAKFKKAFIEASWSPNQRIKCEYEGLQNKPDELISAVEELHSILTQQKLSKAEIESEIKTAINKIDRDLFKTASATTVKKKLADNDLLEKFDKKYSLKSANTAEDLIELITPDFTGFREMDAVKNKVGVEVQFGKYAFMVYNVCAKMTIFHKHGIIDCGIEIVPVKSLQRQMSTGVAFFEQFVWDLKQRGESNIDIPVLIIGIGLD